MGDSKIVSLKDCERIINLYLNSKNVKVTDYVVQPYGETTDGYMGEHLLLKIKILVDETYLEPTFFVKRSLSHYPLSSQYARRMRTFSREILIYQELLPKFKNSVPGFHDEFVPKYYLEKDQNLLVIENLAEEGYVVVETLGIDELKLALATLAMYHAGSFAYEEIKSAELGRNYRLIDEYSEYMEEGTFNKTSELALKWCTARLHSLQALADLIPLKTLPTEEFKAKLWNLSEETFAKMEQNCFRNVLCHGDLWAKNILIKYEKGVPKQCKFVDFALQNYSPPARDVLFLIYLTTSQETRQHFWQMLLDHYYDALKAELFKSNLDIEKILPLWDFEASVSYLLPHTKLREAYCKSFLSASDDYFKRLAQDTTNFEEFIYGDSVPFAVELFKTETTYKEALTKSLLELEDFLTHTGITIEDCFQIIENKIKSTNYELVDYEIKPLGTVSGFLGDYNKLKIRIINNNEKIAFQFFVKFLPTGATQLIMANGTSAFFKEVSMFRKIFPLMQDHGVHVINDCTIPCYLARYKDCVVLDDFDSLNYNVSHPRSPFDYEHLKLILIQLAKFHASSFILEEKLREKTGTAFQLIDHYKEELRESFFSPKETNDGAKLTAVGIDAIAHQIDVFPNEKLKISRQDFKTLGKKMSKLAYEIVKPSKNFRNCICHGDLWSTNLMIKEDNGHPTDCRIIDFQITRYCPPAHDLLCVLYLNTNRKTRIRFMDEFIDFYFEQLKAVLEQNNYRVDKFYSYKDFRASCQYVEPQAVIQKVIYFHMIMSDPDYIKVYMDDENNIKNAFFNDRIGYLTHMCAHVQFIKQDLKSLLKTCRICV